MTRTTRLLQAILLTSILTTSSVVQAQTSDFTYQGKLNDAGSSANGAYDFQFRLMDNPAFET